MLSARNRCCHCMLRAAMILSAVLRCIECTMLHACMTGEDVGFGHRLEDSRKRQPALLKQAMLGHAAMLVL